jgi:hypothetical protein
MINYVHMIYLICLLYIVYVDEKFIFIMNNCWKKDKKESL